MMKDLLTKVSMDSEVREQDVRLMEDETGRKIVGTIVSLLRRNVAIRSPDHLDLDLGLDSLQKIELLGSLEEAFSLKLPADFLSEVPTVGDLVAKIKMMALEGPTPFERRSAWRGLLIGQTLQREEAFLREGKMEGALRYVSHKLIRGIFRTFFRLQVRGVGNLPDPPFIISPNHSSVLDGFVIAAALPDVVFDRLYFQGFQRIFEGLLRSWLARLARVILIDAEGQLVNALQFSSRVLRKDRVLCIFPEGGRSLDGSLREFKRGVGILATELDVPVIPAWIAGTFDSLPRGSKRPRRTRLKVVFGRPLRPGEIDYSRMPAGINEYEFFARELREKVQSLQRLTSQE